jgi:alkanesulfonate monooxygenase SsuD/methylene tetrahydromethanopterin reductase-like flavin-dependent oxidoreductase (luciferase family)
VVAAGLAPLPVQRPIPVWIGAGSARALRRVGRLADGWFPQCRPGPMLAEAMALVRAGAEAAGRNPSSLGMEGRVGLSRGVDAAAEQAAAWRVAGATHLSISSSGIGSGGIDRHIAALADVARTLGLPRSCG